MNSNQEKQTKTEDIFEIAAKAEKLLKEILSSSNKQNVPIIKQEPIVPKLEPTVPTVQQTPTTAPSQIIPPVQYYQPYQQYVYHGSGPGPGPVLVDPSYYVNNPPPSLIPNQYYTPQTPVYYQTYQVPNYYQSSVSLQRAPVAYNKNRTLSTTEKSLHQYNDDCDITNEQDLNLIREKELKDLKCKSIQEKMSVFLKYYKQFKDAYIQRCYQIECSDQLKLQFSSLIKYLNEYDQLLNELNLIIIEHERDFICKNNHRKTKKFFNKSKAFIRYECSKRLQTNIFDYRRQINSQDRYAGMYDLLDMNNHLISLLPDIGVSIRRYINKCEKAKQEELNDDDEYDDYNNNFLSENSIDGNNSGRDEKVKNTEADLTIPSFKDFCANSQNIEEQLEKENNINQAFTNRGLKQYESYSKGIDSLNRYLLKRVDEEQSLDELVKERIIKWINKRQAKYILIFSEVDKLLNQHKAGECYPKFHSYLLFNLGKLVTVCDSYHQKLKELLYSTTIRRKKKRKKVKILPEAMTDVFDEINDLKKNLEYGKVLIKKCNNDLKASGVNNNSSNNLQSISATTSTNV